MSQIKEFIPLILTIISAFVGFSFGQRTNKINRFYTQVENNLRNISEPLYFDLRRIKYELSLNKRDMYIEELFIKYTKDKSGIFQLGNRFLIEWFLRTEKVYNEYKNHKTEENWKQFWIDFEYLYVMSEEEYWNGFLTLYRDYRWFLDNLRSNYFIGKLFEFIRFAKEIINFAILTSLLVIFYSIYEIIVSNLTDFNPLFSQGTATNSFLIFLFLLMIYGFLLIIGSTGPQWNQKQSVLEKIMETKMKKQIGRSKKFEKSIAIPERQQEL